MTENQRLLASQLIQQYREDFYTQTGLKLNARPAVVTSYRIHDEIEEALHIEIPLSFWSIVQLILDCTGWEPVRTFTGQKHESTFRRRIIHLMAISNNHSTSLMARVMDVDHTTIINSIKKAKDEYETSVEVANVIGEIFRYCRDNAYLYKDCVTKKEDVLSGVAAASYVPVELSEA